MVLDKAENYNLEEMLRVKIYILIRFYDGSIAEF